MGEFTGARRVREGEQTRALTFGERNAFAMGAPMAVEVVLTNFGYRVVVPSLEG